MILLLGSQDLFAQATLSGVVTDSGGHEGLGFVSLKIFHGKTEISTLITDENGKYHIQLNPGLYDLVALYAGYEPQRVLNIKLREGQQVIQNVIMLPNVLKEAEITDFKVPLREQFMSGKGLIDFNEKPPKASSEKPKKQKRRCEE